jgi:hypothetical protein
VGAPEKEVAATGLRREGRRAKAAAFREGDCGGTAPNPASIGRIASSLFRACFSLLSPCYLPVPSLLSANNLPVIFTLCARRRAAPYFDNHLKRKIILAAS